MRSIGRPASCVREKETALISHIALELTDFLTGFYL